MASRSETVLGRVEEEARRRAAGGRPVQIRRAERGGRRPPAPGEARAKRGLDDPFRYEVYTESHPDVVSGRRAAGADDQLVRQLKARINASGLTRRHMYEFVGDGPGCLFRDANSAYNLEYGLGERPTITLECLRRWLAVFGEELVVSFQPHGGRGWHDQLVALRGAVLAGRGPAELLAIAEAAGPGEGCMQTIPPPAGA